MVKNKVKTTHEWELLEATARLADSVFPGTLRMFYALNEPPRPQLKTTPAPERPKPIELVWNPITKAYEEPK